MAAATNSTSGRTAFFRSAPDSAARRSLIIAIAFLAVGAIVAVLASVKLAFPSVFDQAGLAAYARLRPTALNLLVYGFGFHITTAATYFVLPRLTGSRLAFEPAANGALFAGAGLVALGSLGLMFGWFNAGGDLSEFPLWLDILLFLVMLVPPAAVTVTLLTRAENTLYPSIWYLAGAQLIIPWLYLVGNLPNINGVGNQLQNTFLVGGLLTVAFPAAAIGAAYYIVPKEADQPLFSRPLAMAGFWTLLFTGLNAGQSRFIGGPAPDWVDTVSAVMSLGLIITALTVAVNVWYTLDGAWEGVQESPALRLTLAGIATHLVVSILFGIQGFRSIAAIVGLTVWYDTLVLTTLLGSLTLLAGGFVYHALPRISGRAVFSQHTAARHLRLTAWSIGAFLALGVIASIVTGSTWSANVVSGVAANIGDGFVESMSSVRTLLTVSTLAVLVAATSAVLFSMNVYRTITSGAATTSEVLTEVSDE